MNNCTIRPGKIDDEKGAYHVCLKTGDNGADGEPFYREDPDALGRIYVGPYLAFEPQTSLILEDAQGICGYSLGAFDSRKFFDRYEKEWRPKLLARFPAPTGDPNAWTRVQQVHNSYHNPDYFMPEPYEQYPSHLHIDLLERARGRRFGRQMIERNLQTLRRLGSPGAHLGLSTMNMRAYGFYQHLGFAELTRVGTPTDGCIYMGIKLK